MLTIIDIISGIEDGPDGKDVKAPAWVPGLQGDEDAPTGFDFAGTPKPTDKLQRRPWSRVTVRWWSRARPSPSTTSARSTRARSPSTRATRGSPASFAIGIGGVIQGWDQVLVGKTVGSRVVMAVPPKLGYGEQGNPSAGIKGTDTLYFVVDILGAA